MFYRHLAGIVPAMVICASATADVVDANLINRMNEVGDEGTVSALIYLNEQVDVRSLSAAIPSSVWGMRLETRW